MLLAYPIVVGVRVLLATPLALDESLFHPPPFPLNPAPLILIPYLPPSIFFQLSSPRFLFHGSLLPSSRPSATPLAQLTLATYTRSKAYYFIAYPDRCNNGSMCECTVRGKREGGGMAKVSTHGRATPVLERSWKEEEEGREGERFLPRARSCSNTAPPCVASLYTVERVTPLRTAAYF